MHTHYIPALLAVVGSLAVSTALAENQSSQGPPPSGQAGVSAEGSGSSEAAAQAGGSSGAELAGDSSVNAVLTKPVDSGKCKPGDPVSARTTQAARTSDGMSIPKGSALVGRVSEVHARGEGEASSTLGIVFDKAVTRDGREIPLRHVGIRALAAAEGAGSASVADSGMMGSAGMGGGAMAAGHGGAGGGLVGRTAGGVGGTVGGGLGAVGGATGSLAGGAGGSLQAGPGAVGGLDASGLLTAGSSGVFGLHGVGLGVAGSGTAQGSLVTSTGKSIHLDQGTRLLLSSQANASAHSNRDSDAAAKPSPR